MDWSAPTLWEQDLHVLPHQGSACYSRSSSLSTEGCSSHADTASDRFSQLELGAGLLPLEIDTRVDCVLGSSLWQFWNVWQIWSNHRLNRRLNRRKALIHGPTCGHNKGLEGKKDKLDKEDIQNSCWLKGCCAKYCDWTFPSTGGIYWAALYP
jgi:hypothetical protein